MGGRPSRSRFRRLKVASDRSRSGVRSKRAQVARSKTKEPPIKLMLVDDHPMWREMLRKVFAHSGGCEVVAEAGDGLEAVTLAGDVAVDIVVMDINLPLLDGIGATQRIRDRAPGVRVLVLASSDERAQVLSAVRAGASGYLLKTAEPRDVVDAVRRVNRGELVFPATLSDVVLEEIRGSIQTSVEPNRAVIGAANVLEREGLTKMLEREGFEVAGAAAEVPQLMQLIAAHQPDVVIIDQTLPGQKRRSLAEELRAKFSDLNILVLSPDPQGAEALDILALGDAGIGYILKDRISRPGELSEALRRVAHHGSAIDPRVVSELVARPRTPGGLSELTSREREVLALMAEGHSNQAIAEKMFVGPRTVEAHVGSIFLKLGLDPEADVNRRVLAVIRYLQTK